MKLRSIESDDSDMPDFILNKIVFLSKADHLRMRAFSYTWSLSVMLQRMAVTPFNLP